MKLLQSCSDVPGASIVLATVNSILIHTPGQVLDTITLDEIVSGRITCLDCRPDLLAVSVAPYGYCVLGNKVSNQPKEHFLLGVNLGDLSFQPISSSFLWTLKLQLTIISLLFLSNISKLPIVKAAVSEIVEK